jgi:hypothetical protein
MTARSYHQVVARGRRSVRRLLLALAIVVVMAPLMPFFGTVGAAQSPNQPIVETVDVTFPAPNLTRVCGFDVTAHVFGTFTLKVLPSGVELQKIRFQHVFTGPGGSQTVNRVENVKFTSTTPADGTLVETLTITGTLMYHQVVPGHGSIGNNSGSEILQFTWQYDRELDEYVLVDELVLFDAGPNNELSDADFAVICEQLA